MSQGAASSPGSRKLDLVLLVVLIGLAIGCMWGGGVFDSDIQRDIRVSNVYVEDGVDLDEAQAEQIVGNRQLVIVMLDGELGDRGSGICDDMGSVAAGSIVTILGEDMKMYPCALIPGYDDENFGKAFVAESQIRLGIRGLVGDPVAAVQAIAVNFDMLIDSGQAPQDARAIDPPFARYIVALVALGMTGIGALLLFLRSRRFAHQQADLTEQRAAVRGRLAERDNTLAAAGIHVLRLDERYRKIAATNSKNRTAGERRFLRQYTMELKTYTELNERATSHEPDDDDLASQITAAEQLLQALSRL